VAACSYPAGVEGVVNKDAALLFTWTPTDTDKVDLDLGYSWQGNLYAGDVLLGSGLSDGGTSLANTLADEGAETNVMERKTVALTHTGDYAWGGLMSFVQYERTNNRRLSEGLNGGSEGAINSDSDWDEPVLDIVSGKSELYLDRTVFGRPSALTLGMEVRHEKLDLSDYTAKGINATMTYFHNHYRDKIQSSTTRLGAYTEAATTYDLFQWDNVPEAVVSGVEGNFAMPLGDRVDVAFNGT